MTNPKLVECEDRLEVRSRTRAAMRVMLAVLSLVPLLAPYELLVKVHWAHLMSPVFFMAALISLGAMGVSAFFLIAAIVGMNSTMVFDKQKATFSYSREAPVIRRTRQEQALSDVQITELGVREWSEGEPSYYLRITMRDGSVYESDSSWSRAAIERIQSRVAGFLATEVKR